MRRLARVARAVAMIGIIALVASPAAASADFTVGFAGTGQDGFTDAPCPAQAAVVGMAARDDQYVEGLGAVCSSLPVPGTISRPAGVFYGSGTDHEDDCPAGDAIVGVAGRDGAWLDQIQPICRAIGPDGGATGPTVALTARGGSGGAPATASCPDPQAAVGIRIVTDDTDAHVAGVFLDCEPLSYPPACAGDEASTPFATPVQVSLSCTGTALAYHVGPAGPARGTAELSGSHLTYTPGPSAFGTDGFEVTATNSVGQAQDLVSMTIAKPPPPSCAGDAASTAFGTPVSVSLSCSGVGLSYEIVPGSGPQHGDATLANGSVRYSPSPGFFGRDSLEVGVTDIAQQSATDAVTIHVLRPGLPSTKISKAKINQGKNSAKFKFKAIGGSKAKASSGFQCALVKKKPHRKPKPRFNGCTSPKRYRHLKPRRYTFEVRAFDSAGKDPTPAKKKFKIK